MIMQNFVDRKEELEELKKAIENGKLIIVYGRRRVGKTRLLLEASREKESLYILCMEEELEELLKRISMKLYRMTGDEILLKKGLSSFDEFFEYIAEREMVVIFDEFPILMKKYPRIMGLMQEYLDFKRKRGSIILCGSSISMMERVKDYQSPIYGRRSESIHVKPLKFRHIKEFFPEYSPVELVETYSVLGGVPEYLLRFDKNMGVRENIYENFFRKSFLYEEAEHLLRYELRDLSTYNTILEGIAAGYTTFSEIRNRTYMDGSKLSRYLGILISLGIVRKELPVTIRTKEKMKKKNARYFIDDNYFNFYYSFVYPFKEDIEIGMQGIAMENFEKNFNQYIGRIFERIAVEFLIESNKTGKVPFKYSRIGRWWRKNEEIDIMAMDERNKKALLVEVKWKDLKDSTVDRILMELERKSSLVEEIDGYERHYAVFAKSFENKDRKDAIVYDLEDMIK